MADARRNVEALVLAAGHGDRLGLGPKALLELGGRTLLARAIEVMQSVAERVIVGVPAEYVGELREVHAGVVVMVGGSNRMQTFLRVFEASTRPWIVQHDVVHPFVSRQLAEEVVAVATRTGAAMAAVKAAEHVYRGRRQLAERVTTPGDALWLARKPLAFSRDVIARALDDVPTSPGAGTAELLLSAGQPIEVVPVDAWNIKITTPADWALARALDAVLPRSSGEGASRSIESTR